MSPPGSSLWNYASQTGNWCKLHELHDNIYCFLKAPAGALFPASVVADNSEIKMSNIVDSSCTTGVSIGWTFMWS